MSDAMTRLQETLLAIYLAGSIAATGHFLARQDTNLEDRIIGSMPIAIVWPYYASKVFWEND